MRLPSTQSPGDFCKPSIPAPEYAMKSSLPSETLITQLLVASTSSLAAARDDQEVD